jgi:hypothetical protein
MTRRTRNADGTITLKSFSYWGDDDTGEALRQELAAIDQLNRQARQEWDSLTPAKQEQRTEAFEAQRKAREAAMATDLEIPPHILAKDSEQEPPD